MSFAIYCKNIQSGRLNIYCLTISDPPDNDTKASIHTNISDGSTAVQLHLKKVYPMPNCTIAGRVSAIII